MRVKSCPAKVKVAAAGDDVPEGQFTALVSVFGTVDSVKDIVMPGAFTKSLAGYTEKGSPIPVVWSHDWDDPFSHIGYTTSAQETEAGLEVTGQLDLDNPKAAQVYRLLKGGRIKDFSFAYDVKDAAGATKDGEDVTELRELDVFEVGPTLVGAHRGTELLDIKAVEPATGQPVAPVTVPDMEEMVQKAVSQFAKDLLDALSRRQGEEISTDGKATPAQPATAEEPVEAKANEPARQGTASARLRTDLELLWLEADSAHE